MLAAIKKLGAKSLRRVVTKELIEEVQVAARPGDIIAIGEHGRTVLRQMNTPFSACSRNEAPKCGGPGDWLVFLAADRFDVIEGSMMNIDDLPRSPA